MTIRKKAIHLAMELAKERDSWTCQKCGKTKPEVQIQGAHIIPIQAKGVIAADPENIIALCSSDHKWAGDSWHESPLDQDWFHKKFPGLFKKLKLKHDPREVKQFEWQEIYNKLKDLKKEIK